MKHFLSVALCILMLLLCCPVSIADGTFTSGDYKYTVLDDGFSKYFGFMEDDVNAILTAAGRTDRKDVVKQWYDGYLFGKNYLYCPWDVINYLSELKKDRDLAAKNN